MNILSVFDGASCGRVALERAGVPVDIYYACEIDQHAVKVTQTNWPDTVQLGSVTTLSDAFIWAVLPRIDLIIGGSPCQGFSFAGKQLNFNDPRSALFFEYVRIWQACKRKNPRVKFFLENVPMKMQYQDVISNLMGVQPVKINSSLVSAQNRKRLYWTDICAIEQPEDKGIFIEDIILPDAWPVTMTIQRTEEAKRIRSEHLKAGRDWCPRKGKELVVRTDKKANCLTAVFSTEQHMILKKIPVIKSYGQLIYKPLKSQCLDANYWKGADNHGQRTGLVSVPSDLIPDLEPGCVVELPVNSWRKLDPIECERLQGLPDGYTSAVSNTQRYKILGNGWQVDTVAHIFTPLSRLKDGLAHVRS